jgi:hypothetical protein
MTNKLKEIQGVLGFSVLMKKKGSDLFATKLAGHRINTFVIPLSNCLFLTCTGEKD